MFLGVMVAGLICSRAPLLAQPTSESVSTDDEPTSTDDEPIVIDDADANVPWSQGVAAEERQAARKLFLEGNRLFRVPLFAKAAEQYAAALSKWKHPAFYFNLALAQLNLGKEIEAHESLEHALEHGEKPLGAEQFEEAQKQLAEVKRQIGRIRVTCRTPGAEVTLDGATLFIGPGSFEGWAKAKSHVVTAKKTGYLSEARRVTVSPAALQDIDLRLITLSQATDASRRWAVWKPWAIVAIGGAITTAGGVLHVLSFRNFNDYDAQFSGLECVKQSDSHGCSEEEIGSDLNNLLGRAKQQQAIAMGSYIIGSSMIIAGIVSLYLNRLQLTERITDLSNRHIGIESLISDDMIGFTIKISH
jgi:tetratricopeptide (TPR) repeat protein